MPVDDFSSGSNLMDGLNNLIASNTDFDRTEIFCEDDFKPQLTIAQIKNKRAGPLKEAGSNLDRLKSKPLML